MRAHEHAHLAVEGAHAAERLRARRRLRRARPDATPSVVGDDVRHRRERRERRRQHHRPGARAAAAMRRREGLVQVDVHGVDAEIAGPHLADDGVEVGAVGIEVGAGRVHRLGDRHHVALEQPAGVGVGQHDGGDVGRELLLHLLRIDRAVRARRHGLDAVAEQRGGRRIGAVRRLRHQHDRSASRRAPSSAALIAIMPHSSPCAPAFGVMRDRRHAGELEQPARQLGDQRRARPARSRAAAADGCRRSPAAAPSSR